MLSFTVSLRVKGILIKPVCCCCCCCCVCVCVCNPILVTTFPGWLSGTEPWPRTPAPCVRPRCVCCVLRAYVQFCRFDKADAVADVKRHCPPLWYHCFPAQSTLGADILVYWTGKIVRACTASGSRTLDFLRERRTPYPLGQALRFVVCLAQ